jgi:hypothetical protein
MENRYFSLLSFLPECLAGIFSQEASAGTFTGLATFYDSLSDSGSYALTIDNALGPQLPANCLQAPVPIAGPNFASEFPLAIWTLCQWPMCGLLEEGNNEVLVTMH